MSAKQKKTREQNNKTQSAPETIVVAANIDQVNCDGGGGPLGHPRVWYSFNGGESVDCGYCDRLFVKETER